MRLVTRTRSLAAAIVLPATMLMNAALAVEVTEIATPMLPPHEQPVVIDSADAISFSKPSKDCFILGSRSFSIPFTVDATGTQPVEVRLFVSRGKDDTWHFIDRKKPDDRVRQFRYETEADGEYWFATRTIDAHGRAHPAGAVVPQLKVFVDTTKPALVMDADADELGSVHASLQISDATPLKIVRLRYVTDTLTKWQNVDVSQFSGDGKLQFTPPKSWKLLSLQLVATDTPGNQTILNQRVRRPRLAEAKANRFAATTSKEIESKTKSLHYRLNASDAVAAKTASSPIVQLDRRTAGVNQPSSVFNQANSQTNSAASRFAGQTLEAAQATPAASMPPAFAPPLGVATRPVQTVPPTQPSWTTSVPSSGFALPQSQTPAFQPRPATQSNPATHRKTTTPGSPASAANPPAYGSVPIYGMRPQFTPPSTANSSRYPATNAPAASNWNTSSPTVPPVASPAGIAPKTNESPMGLSDVVSRGFGGLFSPPATSTDNRQMPFGPPSVRNAITPPGMVTSAPVKSKLPPPATPTQIGEAFDLNSPQQSQVSQENTAGLPQLAPSPPAVKPQPRTAAEAMRPLSDRSAVEMPTQEVIPTPKAEPDPDAGRYRVQRATPVDPRVAMQRAPVRYSDSERFSLEYELEAVGNQGVEAIELYGSLDHGRTWTQWGRDPDRASPFDIETKGEGVFGFRIVVVGANGLASPRPLAGETPDIFVVVDRTKPSVRITGARYGEGDRVGALVIRYECQDANLMRRPIALSFSDTPQGPWTTIAAGLQNDGDYVWRADPNLPRQLYLRIDGTDQAGNVGSSILDQSIDTQGLAPRARIRGFQTLSGGDNPTNAGQTARRNSGGFQ